MPEIISLNAEPRPSAGKGAARATRRSGRVPGIVYGDKKEPVLISLEPRALARIVPRPGFFAKLVDVSVAASSAVKEEAAQAAATAAVAAAAPPTEEPAPAAGPPPTPGAPVTPSA